MIAHDCIHHLLRLLAPSACVCLHLLLASACVFCLRLLASFACVCLRLLLASDGICVPPHQVSNSSLSMASCQATGVPRTRSFCARPSALPSRPMPRVLRQLPPQVPRHRSPSRARRSAVCWRRLTRIAARRWPRRRGSRLCLSACWGRCADCPCMAIIIVRVPAGGGAQGRGSQQTD